MNAIGTTRKDQKDEALQMAKRGRPPEGYYTASITRKKLGNITDGMLRSYIHRGLVKRDVPPGRKQGFYKREEVDKLARSLDNFLSDPKEPGARFQQATAEDMPEIVSLLIETFGGSDTSERRLQWLKKNPETAFTVKSKGKVVGCAFILPLTAKKIEALMDDTTPSTRVITPDDIQLFIPDTPTNLFALSVAVHAGLTDVAKRTRGEILIRGIFRFLLSLGERGIEIESIVSRSDTADGIRLLRHMGFTEVESNTNNRNFKIEVKQSGIPQIVAYKKLLARHKANQTNSITPKVTEQ